MNKKKKTITKKLDTKSLLCTMYLYYYNKHITIICINTFDYALYYKIIRNYTITNILLNHP